MKKTDVVLSLCSGIGAFECALTSITKVMPKIFFSEIDTNAIAVYQQHFPNATPLGNLQKITDDQIHNAISKSENQYVFAGFPCQNISMANNVTRHGLDGVKSSLFYDVIRVINTIITSNTPKKHNIYVILENVRGAKQTLSMITEVLKKNVTFS
jgi:DNA (cytosine-5)-methyltransferase 1